MRVLVNLVLLLFCSVGALQSALAFPAQALLSSRIIIRRRSYSPTLYQHADVVASLQEEDDEAIVVGTRKQKQGWKLWWMSATLAAALSVATPAMAIPTDAAIFNHEYQDPLHPSCRRTIVVSNKEGTRFHYSGTSVKSPNDNNLGCTPESIQQFGLQTEAWDGDILVTGTTRIFRADGVEGVWELANTVDEDADGIRWKDGTKWIVKTKPTATSVGEGIFYSYIGLSTLAGVKGVVDGIQRKLEEKNDSQ